jgi:HEAT repeat protein
MLMDEDNRKKLKQFWRKRLLFGLGTVGVLGLGVGTIALMRSTYDELQIVEGRGLPERFYQQQVADGNIEALGHLQDPRAIPVLGKLLQDDQNRSNGVYTAAAKSLGKFQREDATIYLKATLTKLRQSENKSLQILQDELTLLEAIGESSKYDDSWRKSFFQSLPDMARQSSLSHELRLEKTLLTAIDGHERDPQAIKTLVALSRDPNVPDKVLSNIAHVFQTRPHRYAHLQEMMAIQMMRSGRLNIPGLDDLRKDDSVPDPLVVQSLTDVAQDAKVSRSVKSEVLGKFFKLPPYAEVAGKLYAAVTTDNKDQFNLEVTRLEALGISRRVAPLASGSPAQRQARSLLVDLSLISPDSVINPEYRSLLSKLQALPKDANPRILETQAERAKAIALLRSALAYPVSLSQKDIQPSEQDSYAPKQWDIPCVLAATLIHLGQSEGIQPCLVGLKTVAATKYATEEQRRLIVGGGGGSGRMTRFGDAEYRFSAMDVAVFRWYQSPRSQYDGARDALLIALLGESDVEVRRAAMFTLSGIDLANEYLPSVTAALKDPDSVVRQYAIRYFRLRVDSIEDLAEKKMLEDAGYVRGTWEPLQTGFRMLLFYSDGQQKLLYFSYAPVDRSLAQNTKYTQAVTALRQGTQNADAEVSQAARLALSQVAQDTNQDFLLSALHSPQAQIRRNSLNSLCRMGIQQLPSVAAALNDRGAGMQGDAISCLASWVTDLESNDRRIAPVLMTTLDSIPPLSEGFHEALEALEQLADRGALEVDAAQTRRAILTLLKANQAKIDRNFMFTDNHQARIDNALLLEKRTKIMRLLRVLYDRLPPTDQSSQNRTYLLWNLERGLLAGLGITALILLFSSIRLRNPFPLIWSGYLIFPEEIVAELVALKQRRQAENVSPKRIRRELAYEVILLLWAVHVQIRIDNLHLPPGGNDRAK